MPKILNRHSGEVVLTYDGYLRGSDLQRANLQGADLQRADMQDADLQGANLQGANLQEANLHGANLQGADLRRATLQNATLQRANLREANLWSANLQGANLQEANMQGANLCNAECLTATGNLLRLCGTRHPIIVVDANNVSIGCHRKPLAEWLSSGVDLAEKECYSTLEIQEYRILLECVGQWLENRRKNNA